MPYKDKVEWRIVFPPQYIPDIKTPVQQQRRWKTQKTEIYTSEYRSSIHAITTPKKFTGSPAATCGHRWERPAFKGLCSGPSVAALPPTEQKTINGGGGWGRGAGGCALLQLTWLLQTLFYIPRSQNSLPKWPWACIQGSYGLLP